MYENKENKHTNVLTRFPSTKKCLLFSKLLSHKKVEMSDLKKVRSDFNVITRKLGDRHFFIH